MQSNNRKTYRNNLGTGTRWRDTMISYFNFHLSSLRRFNWCDSRNLVSDALVAAAHRNLCWQKRRPPCCEQTNWASVNSFTIAQSNDPLLSGLTLNIWTYRRPIKNTQIQKPTYNAEHGKIKTTHVSLSLAIIAYHRLRPPCCNSTK